MSTPDGDTPERWRGQIIAFLRSIIPVTMRESGSEYDGPFSTYKEHHSFYIGLGAGATGNPAIIGVAAGYALRGVPERAPSHLKDVAKEPAYAMGGIVLGLILMGHYDLLALVPFV